MRTNCPWLPPKVWRTRSQLGIPPNLSFAVRSFPPVLRRILPSAMDLRFLFLQTTFFFPFFLPSVGLFVFFFSCGETLVFLLTPSEPFSDSLRPVHSPFFFPLNPLCFHRSGGGLVTTLSVADRPCFRPPSGFFSSFLCNMDLGRVF